MEVCPRSPGAPTGGSRHVPPEVRNHDLSRRRGRRRSSAAAGLSARPASRTARSVRPPPRPAGPRAPRPAPGSERGRLRARPLTPRALRRPRADRRCHVGPPATVTPASALRPGRYRRERGQSAIRFSRRQERLGRATAIDARRASPHRPCWTSSPHPSPALAEQLASDRGVHGGATWPRAGVRSPCQVRASRACGVRFDDRVGEPRPRWPARRAIQASASRRARLRRSRPAQAQVRAGDPLAVWRGQPQIAADTPRSARVVRRSQRGPPLCRGIDGTFGTWASLKTA